MLNDMQMVDCLHQETHRGLTYYVDYVGRIYEEEVFKVYVKGTMHTLTCGFAGSIEEARKEVIDYLKNELVATN
ncbi:hypothetical protein [Priestia koreensis]|uniref:hypothetical protein n=2 Tax=Priestia koreensis TaxID=284581 RepID=UPI0030194CF4